MAAALGVLLLKAAPVSHRHRAFSCSEDAVSLRTAHRRQTGDVTQLRRNIRCKGFLDELTDFINAGPKLRKWYGEGELPTDADRAIVERMPEPEDIKEEEVVQDAVLVTDADSATGEQVVLQLILSRLPVKIITRDGEEAKRGYGPYVTAFTGDIGDAKLVSRALRGVRAVICPGKLGAVPQTAAEQGVEHIVLLSSAGVTQNSGISLPVLWGEQAVLRDPSREVTVQQCGTPCTIVRTGRVKDIPGRKSKLEINQDAQDAQDISREDIAKVLVAALQAQPENSLTFQVTARGPGRPPKNWVPILRALNTSTAAKSPS